MSLWLTLGIIAASFTCGVITGAVWTAGRLAGRVILVSRLEDVLRQVAERHGEHGGGKGAT